MAKKLLEIAAEIVQTQAASTSMNALEIASSLRQVFLTLQEIQKSETAGIVLVPQMMPEETPKPVAPQDSIKVICRLTLCAFLHLLPCLANQSTTISANLLKTFLQVIEKYLPTVNSCHNVRSIQNSVSVGTFQNNCIRDYSI